MRNMYILHILGFLIFILSFVYSMSSITWLGCWLGMEIGNLMLYMWFNVNYLNRNIILGSLYYWVSGISGFGILGCYFFYNLFPFITTFGFIFFFCLKMGLFPFYGWVLMIFKHMDYFIFFILSSVLKIPLLIMMDFFIDMNYTFMIMFGFFCSYMSLFIGLSGMSQMNLKGVLGYSSINVASDFFIGYMLSYDLFLFIMINYIFILMGAFMLFMLFFGNINFFNTYGIKNLVDNNKLYEFIFLSLFGMPFFLSFYIKFFSGLYFLNQGFSVLNLFIFFLLMMLACLNYYRCWSYMNYNYNFNLVSVSDMFMNHFKIGGYYYFFFLGMMLVGMYFIFMSAMMI